MAKPYEREHQIQADIVRVLRLAFASGVRIWAIPNGGHLANGAIGWKRLEEEGATAGAPDLVIVAQTGQVIWLEVKTPDGKLTDRQAEFRAFLLSCGHPHYIVRCGEDALEACKDHGLLRRSVRVAA
jgi:hypothetical protein